MGSKQCDKVGTANSYIGTVSSSPSTSEIESSAIILPMLGSSVSVTPVPVGSSVSVTVAPAEKPDGSRNQSIQGATLSKNAFAAERLLVNVDPSTSELESTVTRKPSDSSPSVSVETFTFKTPSPVGTIRSSNVPKPSVTVSVVKGTQNKKNVTQSLSSKSQSMKIEPSSEVSKASQPSKRKPAVKIASFAKTSESENSSSQSSSPVTPQSTQKTFDSSLSSFSSLQLSNAVGSKQSVTQTSLPTPALNASLRSFFSYDSKSEVENTQDADLSDSEEEEEILVYMQFDSKLDGDLLQPHTPFKIIGIESEKPVLQLGNQVFEGNWTDTIGTAVFFEEHPSASPGDPVFMKNPPSTLKYHSKTQKALIMSRIFVKPKDGPDDCSEDVPDLASSPHSSAGPPLPVATVEVTP